MIKMNNVKHAMTIIVLAAGLYTAGLVWFIEAANSRYVEVNKHWTEYSETESKVVEAILQLKGQLGYGGFIHSFKNYVLRGDETYFNRLSNQHLAVTESINSLRQYLKSDSELAALNQLEETMGEYWSNVLITQTALAADTLPHDVDRLVKVDDTPALSSLRIIEVAISKRTKSVQKNTTTSIQSAQSFLERGMLLVLPVLLLSLLLLYYIREVYASNQAVIKARKWLDTVLDTAPDATLCVNRSGQIIRSNQMAESFFGYSQSDLKQMTVESLIPIASAKQHKHQRESFFQNPDIRPMGQSKELYAQLKNGRQPMVEVSLSHTGEANDVIAIATIRDVTEREENRKQLVQAKAQAEEALSQTEEALTQLEKAKDSLVESEKMAALGELVAGVAHEINTPIGNALTSATYLHDQTEKIAHLYEQEELSEEELETYFQRSNDASNMIEVNLDKAADLINSFKHIAVDQTGGERREFNLNQYLREVLVSIRPIYKKTNIEVNYQCDQTIALSTYPGALSQCLTNLITNAVVHGFDEQSSGKIDITVSDSGTDKVNIAISDNGKGIPSALHKKIFEPFFTTKRNHGGSGLGLQIVYNLVTHNLGGSITLQSQDGEGSTFSLEIPRHFNLVSADIE